MDDPVHPKRGDQPVLFGPVRQMKGRFIMPEKFPRMRIKRHNAHRQPARRRGAAGSLDHLLVAAMHTVEIANGGNHFAEAQRRVTNGPTHDLAWIWIVLNHGAALYRATCGNINDVNALFHPTGPHLWHNATLMSKQPG